MNRDQEIIREIGKLLWSIFREDADRSVFLFQRFPNVWGGGTSVQYFSKGLSLKKIEGQETPSEIWNKMSDLACELQRTPPFANSPFTHMRFEMDEQGKTQVDFAYIPEWDSWPGLFMRGVSELSEQEARDPSISSTWGVDLAHWQECRARREREPYTK